MDAYKYQDALGNWIVWDGQQKHRGLTEAGAAQLLREMERMSAMQEWADSVRQLTKKAEGLIDATAPGKRLRIANGLDEIIEETPDEELVPGSDMTGARAKELLTMYNKLEEWLGNPIDGSSPSAASAPTPIQIISRRE